MLADCSLYCKHFVPNNGLTGHLQSGVCSLLEIDSQNEVLSDHWEALVLERVSVWLGSPICGNLWLCLRAEKKLLLVCLFTVKNVQEQSCVK